MQGTGQQLGQCHPDHDARRQHNGAVQKARREEPTQEQPRQHRPERLGQAGDEARPAHPRCGGALRKQTARPQQSPSGILCRAMAAAVRRPSDGSAVPAKKVSTPSGKLCSSSASPVTSAVRMAAARAGSPLLPKRAASAELPLAGAAPADPRSASRAPATTQPLRRRPAAAGSPVKRQRLRHQVGQRRREHDPARKARADRQQTLRRRAKYGQQPAQAGGQPGEGGKVRWVNLAWVRPLLWFIKICGAGAGV